MKHSQNKEEIPDLVKIETLHGELLAKVGETRDCIYKDPCPFLVFQSGIKLSKEI